MFWKSVRPLLKENNEALEQFDKIRSDFSSVMQKQLREMWTKKLGLREFDGDLFNRLMMLMIETGVDFTIFFRELSHIPDDVSALKKSFYNELSDKGQEQWQHWLNDWHELIRQPGDLDEISRKMKQVNPKYTWREWLIVPAYENAMQGDYQLIKELKEVLSCPYDEQSEAIENKYYRLKPEAFFNAGGVSHYSCSS